MTREPSRMTIQTEMRMSSLCDAIFLERLIEEGYSRCVDYEWETEVRSLDVILGTEGGLRPLLQRETKDSLVGLFLTDDAIILVELSSGRVKGRVAVKESEPDRVVDQLRSFFPVKPQRERPIEFAFWALNARWGSARRFGRALSVPTWDEISANYAAPTASTLEPLMRRREPLRTGQLMLWHGDPAPGRRSRCELSLGNGDTGAGSSSSPTQSNSSAMLTTCSRCC